MVEADFSIQFDEEKRIAIVTMTGKPDRALILKAFDETIGNERYKPGMGRLWDFQKADLSLLESSSIISIVDYTSNCLPDISNVKIAFLVARKLEYGLARMFETFSEDAKTSVRSFYSMDEALEWITSR
jgi:hypothetical protein